MDPDPGVQSVFGIWIRRIRRIRMLLDLQDPDPDPLVRLRGTDPAPGPSLSEIMLAK
jgi:hypothetical protein